MVLRRGIVDLMRTDAGGIGLTAAMGTGLSPGVAGFLSKWCRA
jgi:hypothetical protein